MRQWERWLVEAQGESLPLPPTGGMVPYSVEEAERDVRQEAAVFAEVWAEEVHYMRRILRREEV